jgi:hypothetical protein
MAMANAGVDSGAISSGSRRGRRWTSDSDEAAPASNVKPATCPDTKPTGVRCRPPCDAPLPVAANDVFPLVAGPSRWFEYATHEDGLSEVGIADDFAPAANRCWPVISSEAAHSI